MADEGRDILSRLLTGSVQWLSHPTALKLNQRWENTIHPSCGRNYEVMWWMPRRRKETTRKRMLSTTACVRGTPFSIINCKNLRLCSFLHCKISCKCHDFKTTFIYYPEVSGTAQLDLWLTISQSHSQMLTGLCPYQMAQLWKELFLKGGSKVHFLAASPRSRVVVSSSLVAGGCFHHLKECHSLPTPDKVVYFLKANYESQMKLAPG